MKTIYFLSSNQHKIREVQTILSSRDLEVVPVARKIHEIQSEDMEAIARDKALKAHQIIARPILVEQTGLLLRDYGNLPGGLTQIFWDALQAERFCELFSKDGKTAVTAKIVMAYCDGKKVYTFDGETHGILVNPPRGDRAFQWDCVFQPIGYTETFAEMGDEKHNVSMRKIALEKLRAFLEGIE